MRSVCAVILAAGLGKRMQSSLPKVLHEVCWRPLVSLVRDALRGAGVDRVVAVVPPGSDQVRAAVGPDTIFVAQDSRLGTAHAASCALPALGDASTVLLLYGDTPLLTAATINNLVSSHLAVPAGGRPWPMTLLTSVVADPTGYGRIVRDGPGGQLREIVEQVECTAEQAGIAEINTGIYCFGRECLERYLPQVRLRQPQGEYYLTDFPALVIADGGRVQTVAADPDEVVGINTRAQLAAAGEALRRREVAHLMASGVTVVDPASTYVAPGVPVGADSVIHPHCFLLPGTSIGRECTVGPGAYLDRARLGDRVRVWFSTVEDSEVGPDCSIGPYAHLRPGTVLAGDVKVGNYAEIKNSNLGQGTKVSHHSYVGDADVGAGVNVGAGAVFVNYDGLEKRRTGVADGSFIGCNVNLVAPVKLGERAYVACGSTIVQDVPGEALAIAREHQRNIPGWVRRRRAGTVRGENVDRGRQEDSTKETK